MPYIPQEKRKNLLPLLDRIESFITDAGSLNYACTVLARRLAKKRGDNYAAKNEAFGALQSCAAEFYRREMADYEDDKMAENGDVEV